MSSGSFGVKGVLGPKTRGSTGERVLVLQVQETGGPGVRGRNWTLRLGSESRGTDSRTTDVLDVPWKFLLLGCKFLVDLDFKVFSGTFGGSAGEGRGLERVAWDRRF